VNGHSTAETLAYSLLEAQRDLHGEIQGSADRPTFIFAAGWDTGARELAQRLRHAVPIVLGQSIDTSLLDALARQFLHFACDDLRGSCDAQISDTDGSAGRARLQSVVRAQAQFLRALAARQGAETDKWGMELIGVPGDYALHLRLLFPRAKIVFLHRDAIQTFKRSLDRARSHRNLHDRDIRWAASFAEGWCALVASYELWRGEAGAIMVGYEQVIQDPATMLEEYLGETLAVLPDKAIDKFAQGQVGDDEVKLVVARTADLASRLGYDTSRLIAARPLGEATKRSAAPVGRQFFDDAAQPNCAVLVPTMRYIEPDCDAALRELERRGYVVRRLHGCSAIDAARNRLATWALDEGFAETLWVDSDTGFDPEVVERIRSHKLPIVAGLCAKKNPLGGLAVAGLPGAREFVMGDAGGITEIMYAGMGFTLVRREVYEAIQHRFELPTCSPSTARRSIPFFMPMLERWDGEMSYLSEDYAFSRRARLCGFKIMADTSIRLWHIGMYRYGYEDAGNAVERVATYRHVFESEDRRRG
jgi:hypothetical protein